MLGALTRYQNASDAREKQAMFKSRGYSTSAQLHFIEQCLRHLFTTDCRMSFAVNRSVPKDWDIAAISDCLAKWYDAHASVRRLWAVEEGSLLAVYLSLEPTFDGDDALPVWLAMKNEWSSDLASIIPRESELRFVASDAPSSYVSGDSVIIAEANWRESWSHS